jgi:hypothetical protein
VLNLEKYATTLNQHENPPCRSRPNLEEAATPLTVGGVGGPEKAKKKSNFFLERNLQKSLPLSPPPKTSLSNPRRSALPRKSSKRNLLSDTHGGPDKMYA